MEFVRGFVPQVKLQKMLVFKSTQDLNSMIPIDKPKTSEDGAEMVLAMALIPETSKRPNGTFLLDI